MEEHGQRGQSSSEILSPRETILPVLLLSNSHVSHSCCRSNENQRRNTNAGAETQLNRRIAPNLQFDRAGEHIVLHCCREGRTKCSYDHGRSSQRKILDNMRNSIQLARFEFICSPQLKQSQRRSPAMAQRHVEAWYNTAELWHRFREGTTSGKHTQNYSTSNQGASN